MTDPKDLTPAALASLYAEIFETDVRGQTILLHLERKYARPAVTEGGIDAVLQTYLRVGQRELLDSVRTTSSMDMGATEQ